MVRFQLLFLMFNHGRSNLSRWKHFFLRVKDEAERSPELSTGFLAHSLPSLSLSLSHDSLKQRKLRRAFSAASAVVRQLRKRAAAPSSSPLPHLSPHILESSKTSRIIFDRNRRSKPRCRRRAQQNNRGLLQLVLCSFSSSSFNLWISLGSTPLIIRDFHLSLYNLPPCTYVDIAVNKYNYMMVFGG